MKLEERLHRGGLTLYLLCVCLCVHLSVCLMEQLFGEN